MTPSDFIEGDEVEVTSNEPGFEGSWFVGRIVGKLDHKYLVEYRDLLDEDDPTKKLRETADFVHVRPVPPQDNATKEFQLGEDVDVFYNDGWWKGVVTKVPTVGSNYSVFFIYSNEETEYERSSLRTHLEWVDGKWVSSQNQSTMEQGEVRIKDKTCHGPWFPATIHRKIGESFCLISYKRVRSGEDVEQLTEIVDSVRVRPSPPCDSNDKRFDVLEKVDAFYKFGWWTGVINKLLASDRYTVFFKCQNEEKEFDRSELRIHMDWMDNGTWSLESREEVTAAECEGSVQRINQTCSSICRTDMDTPQPGNVVRDVVWENVCFSRRKVCRKLDGQSIPNQTKSPYFTMENTKHLDPKSISEVSRTFKKRKEGETEKDSICVKACHARETSIGVSSDAHVLSSRATCKSILEPSGVMGFPKPDGNSHKRNHIVQPTVQDPEPLCSMEIKLQGVRVGTQQGVDKKKRGRPKRGGPSGSGKKHKRRSKSNSGMTFESKVGHEKKSLSNEVINAEAECKPLASYIVDHLGHGTKSHSNEVIDAEAECEPLASYIVDHLSQSMSLEKPSTLEDTGGPSVKELNDVSACPPLSRDADKQIVRYLKIKTGLPKNSHEQSSVTGPEKECPGKEMTDVQTECMPSMIHYLEERPSYMFLEESNSHKVEGNEGLQHEVANEEMAIDLTELSPTAEKSQPLSPQLNHQALVLGLSPDCDLTQNDRINQREKSIESISLSECLEEYITFDDQYRYDNTSGDERALHSTDITANTIASPTQRDENPVLPQDASVVFNKSSKLWGILESNEVFQLMPQKPHFLPLEKYHEELREGHAMGGMLNFVNAVERTWKAKIDEPRSILENRLKVLTDLEELGFIVQPVRIRLIELLKIKDKYTQLDERSKTAEREVTARKRKIDELLESITELNKRLETLVMEKEMKVSDAAEQQRVVDAIKERIQCLKKEFYSMTAFPLVRK